MYNTYDAWFNEAITLPCKSVATYYVTPVKFRRNLENYPKHPEI